MLHNALRRRAGVFAAAAVTAAGLTIAGASTAFASDGRLTENEFGLFYNSNYAGCVFDLSVQDENFSNDYFQAYSSSCSRQGQTTNDNTASYGNEDSYTWYVYTDANADGSEGWLEPGYWGNASSTFKNKISSAYWFDAH